MYNVLSMFNTTTEVPLSKAPNPQLLPGHCSINGCPLLRVCVPCCVCALGCVNAEHEFQVWVVILGCMSRHFTLLSYCPDGGNGDFQCFNSFLTATFYFVMLNKYVLHIRTIFLSFTHCDGWLREFGPCVPHIYNLWNSKSSLDNFMLLVTLGVLKI